MFFKRFRKNRANKYNKELDELNKKQEEFDLKIKKEKQKSSFKSIINKLKFENYVKTLVAVVIFVSLVDLQLSYILAFLGRENIAEKLSIQICTTILGTVLIYIIRSYFDDKNNPTKIDTDGIKDKAKEILEDTGLSDFINKEREPENPDDV